MQIPCLRKQHILVCEKDHSESAKKFAETDIIKMLDLLIDNIFVMFGERVFQRTLAKRVGTICVPLLSDLSLYLYEADFIQGLLNKTIKS